MHDTFRLDLENRLDYAHAGPAFTTWHKYFHVLFEWEMQYMLKSMGHRDYHTFRLPYWDWRIDIQRSTGILAEDLFTENRMGLQGMSVVFLVYLEISLVMDGTQYVGIPFFRFVILMLIPVPFNVVHSQELIRAIAIILTGPQVSK